MLPSIMDVTCSRPCPTATQPVAPECRTGEASAEALVDRRALDLGRGDQPIGLVGGGLAAQTANLAAVQEAQNVLADAVQAVVKVQHGYLVQTATEAKGTRPVKAAVKRR